MRYDAAFLDRDGTLIEDPGYLSDPSGVVLRPDTVRAVRELNRVGIPVLLVTNQSGIGRGYYTVDDFLLVQAELERRLASEGARLDGVYFCPHDPGRETCACRKPGVGMFTRAAREHGLRLDRCLFVGDRIRDVEPGIAFGADCILVGDADQGYDARTVAGVRRTATLHEVIREALRTERQLSQPYQIAVFVSGSGTNLQALLDRFQDDERVRVARVVSSRPGVGALDRAERAGVPWSVLPAGSSGDALAEAMLSELAEAGADLVVLAGFLKLVPASVVRAYRGRILNIHPALLPCFGGSGMYGHHVHEAVIDSGARISGATVHIVDEEYDRGPIVAQWPVPVLEDDDADALAARILKVEHRLLPEVVQAFADGTVTTGPAGSPVWKDPFFAGERFVLDPPSGRGS